MRFPTLVAITVGACALTACQTSPQKGLVDESSSQSQPSTVAQTEVVANEPPISAPVNLITPHYEDIWQRMRAGFILSHEVDRKRVLQELKWFVKHPEYVDRVAKRSAPHLHYIVNQLEKEGLPLEFALLPIVESAYDPFAYSHGRASGLWQFIPSTGRLYGLKIDWWYDGRRDVRASTDAAITYLKHLHKLFNGDWLLALAAYNAGQGNVLSSIRKTGLPRDEADFWSLNILRETYTYVPRLLAISEIFANPAKYHIILPNIANEPHWQSVDTGGQLDLNKAAALAGIEPKELYFLNPGYNQWATHPEGPHQLLLPIEAADRFSKAIAALPATDRVAWQRHKVRVGENLGLIAQKYNTTIDTIRTANDISGNMIRSGDSLLIPSASSQSIYHMTQAGRLAERQKTLARSFGAEPLTHIVEPGDSLWEISRKYKVNVRTLARWNGMGTTGILHPGTELKIFQKKASVKAVSITQREQVRKLNYRVRAGESLSLIASKFNISVQNIRNWNEDLTKQKYIHPGDRLTLYVDVTSLIN